MSLAGARGSREFWQADLESLKIPLDHVDREFFERPRRLDISEISKFMLVIGPLSSVFDFLTFYIMLHVFHAEETLFHTGWFVESLASQVLVIFVIRTRGSPLRSKPRAILTMTSMAVVAVAASIPYTPLGARLGFVPVPGLFFLILVGLVLAYLTLVQAAKTRYYRRLGAGY